MMKNILHTYVRIKVFPPKAIQWQTLKNEGVGIFEVCQQGGRRRNNEPTLSSFKKKKKKEMDTFHLNCKHKGDLKKLLKFGIQCNSSDYGYQMAIRPPKMEMGQSEIVTKNTL